MLCDYILDLINDKDRCSAIRFLNNLVFVQTENMLNIGFSQNNEIMGKGKSL